MNTSAELVLDRPSASPVFGTARLDRVIDEALELAPDTLAVPRGCPGPRSFSVNPAITPRGWSVKILGNQTAIRPGKRRVVRVKITAPKGAGSAATAVPIAITSVATASADSIRRPVRKTVAPSFANARATAPPMPPPAP